MSHPETPDADLPSDVDQVLMSNSARDELLDLLRRIDETIANTLVPCEGPPTAADLELMSKIDDWVEHSRRVQHVLAHITTDEQRIAHLDFSVERGDSAEHDN